MRAFSDDRADRFRALFVTADPGFVPTYGPAAIAVHDDRNVSRQAFDRHVRQALLWRRLGCPLAGSDRSAGASGLTC